MPIHHHADTANKVYGVPYWSNDYFFINPEGQLAVKPFRNNSLCATLTSLVQQAKNMDLRLPILVRFPDIIRERITELSEAFQASIKKERYTGTYTAVYPIKVNQQKDVVQAINDYDKYSIGLEAGSKPELLAVLAMAKPGQVIICNGYKDTLFMRYALLGQQLGHQVYVIIEKLTELDTLLAESQRLGIKPQIGFRVRLASIGTGKWQNTGGDKGKFGLSATQVITAIDRLRVADLLDTVQVMHFHMGSQIANIRDIQKGLHEAARFYCELTKLGAKLQYADVGGGLGIDYEGNKSRSDCSINYSVQEYTHNVVKIFADVCSAEQIAHPNIITEAGRAMVAHHAVLITDIIDTEEAPGKSPINSPKDSDHALLHTLWQSYQAVTSASVIEEFHEAHYHLGEVQSLFTYGQISLAERSKAESIYYAFLQKIKPMLSIDIRAHRKLLDEMNEKLATKIFLNFSVFQSIPDVWAIEQIFPIMPLSHLNEPLTERGIIEDLTCDSDGRIDKYIDNQNIEATCPLPAFDPTNPYLMGLFLVGAYQETLGDIHNLFGDTDTVNVVFDATKNQLVMTAPRKGDSASQVLQYVALNKDELLAKITAKLATCNKTLQANCLETFSNGFDDATYLQSDSVKG